MKKSWLGKGSKIFTPGFMNRKSRSNLKLSILRGDRYDVDEKFIHRMFEENLEKNLNHKKTALIHTDSDVPKRKTQYSELNTSANQIAHALLALMMTNATKASPTGDWIVLVCMKPSDQLVTTLLAIWKAGAAYLPTDVTSLENRLELIMNEAKPALVIYDDSYKSPEYFDNVHSIKFSDLKQMSIDKNSENIPDEMTLTKGLPGTVAIVLYTSGSAGVPKGVRLRHLTFIHRIYWQLKFHPFSQTEKFCVLKTALTFVDHVAELWSPLIEGRSLVILSREVSRNPELLVHVLEEYKIERFLGVPSLLRGCLLYTNRFQSKKMLSHLRTWMSSGEPLTIKLAEEFFEYFGSDGSHVLANYYGCTELNCDAVTFDLRSHEFLDSLERVPLGKPLSNTVVYVLDRKMGPVSEGEQGEIYVAGINVAEGYITGQDDGFMTNPFESNLPFSRMFRTGDHGYVRDGLLYYTGRHDSQVKVNGYRVDISEIENNTNALGYIQRSAILVYHPGQLEQALIAYVTFERDFQSIKKSVNIEAELRVKMPEYMVPQVFILDEFPLLPNGKVDRQALMVMYVNVLESQKIKIDLDGVSNEMLETAKTVFETIGNVLGPELRNKISVDAKFFELGGNSLNTVAAVAELRNKGFNISVANFLQAENLGEVLHRLTSEQRRSTNGQVFVTEPLDQNQRDECVNLLATSFFMKGGLEDLLEGHKLEHLVELVDGFWNEAVDSGLGFMVKNVDEVLVGVAVCFDVLKHPEIVDNVVTRVAGFIEALELKVAHETLKAEVGDVLHEFMSSALHQTPQENVAVITFIEAEIISQAKANGFKYVLTTNTSPLTQQLATSVFGYEVAMDFKVNEWIDGNGKKPFERAPDSNRVVVAYKNLQA